MEENSKLNPISKIIMLALVTFIVTGLVLSVVSPAVQMTPGRDSGIYLYTGWRMLEGDSLYREVWDHKPPLIFYIQAAGLEFAGGSVWGVWVMQVLFVFTAFIFAAFLLLQFSTPFQAGWVLLAGLTTLFYVLHGGNFTEEYALPFQLGAAFLIFQAERKGYNFWRSFGLGLLLAGAFHLRQNLIGVGLALVIVLVLRALFSRNAKGLLPLLPMAAGFGLVAGLWVVIFVVQGALTDYWQTAFDYNFYYSNLGLLEYLQGMQDALIFILTVPGFVAGMVAWLLVAVALGLHFGEELGGWLRKPRPGWVGLGLGVCLGLLALLGELISRDGLGLLQISMLAVGALLALVSGLHISGWLAHWLSSPLEQQRLRFSSPQTALLAAVCLVWLPLEVIFIGMSARNYVHYFISLVPVTVVLTGLIQHWLLSLPRVKGFPVWPVMLALLLTIAYRPGAALMREFDKAGSDAQVDAAVQYIKENTTADEPVLVWGAEPVVNLLSRRNLPTRYIHLYPFYVEHPGIQQMSSELLQGIVANPPILIVDTMNEELAFIEPLDGPECFAPGAGLPGSMPEVFAHVCQNYEYVTTIGPEEWRVYRLMENR